MKRIKFTRKNAVKVVSCSGPKLMRYAFVALAMMAVSSCNDLLKQHPNYYDYQNDSALQCHFSEKQYLDSIDYSRYEFDGLWFNSANVVETFNYDNRVFYMVYDDADAGMDMAIIRLNEETFHLIEEQIKRHNELEGTLQATRPFESVEYVLEVERS